MLTLLTPVIEETREGGEGGEMLTFGADISANNSTKVDPMEDPMEDPMVDPMILYVKTSKNTSKNSSSSLTSSSSFSVDVSAENVERLIVPKSWPLIALFSFASIACFETWAFVGMAGYGVTPPRLWIRARLKIYLLTWVFLPLNLMVALIMFTVVCRNTSWMTGVDVTRRLRASNFLTTILVVIACFVILNNLIADLDKFTPTPCYASNRTGSSSSCDPCTDENICPKSWGYGPDVAYCHTQPTKEVPIMCGYRNCHKLDDCAASDVDGSATTSIFIGFPILLQEESSGLGINFSCLCGGSIRVLILVWHLMVCSKVLHNHEEKIQQTRNGVDKHEEQNTWTMSKLESLQSVPFLSGGLIVCFVGVMIIATFPLMRKEIIADWFFFQVL